MVYAPSSKPHLYLSGGKIGGTICRQGLWDPPAHAIVPEDFYDVGRSIIGEVEDAEPVGITVNNDQVSSGGILKEISTYIGEWECRVDYGVRRW
jgi:hypothetical protein